MSRTARFGIALTPHARQQLEAEMAWSRRRWGRRHQQSFRKALLVRLNAIAANPYALAVRPEAGAEVRLARHGGIYIAYTIDPPAGRVVVIAFPSVHRELSGSLAEALEASAPDAGETE